MKAAQLKVSIVFGTRPEIIKLFPVIRELKKQQESFSVRLLATSQHREMLQQMLQLFGIEPDADFDLMEPNQTPSGVAAKTLLVMEKELTRNRPDILLVQGDTTTALSAALAAFLARIKVGHVEAGLRSGERENPFPEEMNRILISKLASLHFAPTAKAQNNLRGEEILPECISITGNTVVDTLHYMLSQNRVPSPEVQGIIASGKKPVLITAHRRESHGEPLRVMCNAIRKCALKFPAVDFVFPVHPNPAVTKPVSEMLSNCANIKLFKPQDYGSFVQLMHSSRLIVTDSGGIQEEAPYMGVPVLVFRLTCDRPESIEQGCAKLIGIDGDRLEREVTGVLEGNSAYNLETNRNLYGDGKAAQRIAAALLKFASDNF